MPTIAPKRLLFQKAVDHINPLLENHNSFTVSDITAFMMSLNERREELIILNRDVKKLLIEFDGDTIQFAKNPRQTASELIFS